MQKTSIQTQLLSACRNAWSRGLREVAQWSWSIQAHTASLPRGVIVWYSRLELILPACTLLLVLMLIRASFGRSFEWHWPENVGYSVPAPVAFVLWLSTWDGGQPPRGALHRGLVPLVYILIAWAALAAAYPPWQAYRIWSAAAAVLAALVMETGVASLYLAALREPRTACLAAFLGGSLYIYRALFESVWELLKPATIWIMEFAAVLLQFDLTLEPMPPDMVKIGVHGLEVLLAPPCSGMDGVTLFCCLLSIFLLLEWRSVRHVSLLLVFLTGIAFVFLCNALRILLLIAIGSIGASFPVGTTGHVLLDVMFAMFHENVGWVIYTLVFCAYASWIRRDFAGESL